MPLFWHSLAFLFGIALAKNLALPLWAWGIFAFMALLISFLFKNNANLTNKITTHSLLPVLFLLGAAYYQFGQPQINAFHIAHYTDRKYEMLITGSLAEPPDYRDTYTNLKIKVSAVDSGSGDMPVKGFILVRVPANQTYQYGERLRLRGELKTPPENEEFSYRDYLARQGIYAYLPKSEVTRLPGLEGNYFLRLVYTFKANLLTNIYRLFPDPEASLFAGILIGIDTGLPAELKTAFKNTGTAHIIAISGFNIAIIAGLFFNTFKWLLKKEPLAATLTILFIFLYALLVGMDAAVFRAAAMSSIAIFGKQVGKRTLAMNTLGSVAFLMMFLDPLVIWDVGFQLSFLATLGLILYAEPLSNLAARFLHISTPGLLRWVNENVMLTVAAQIMTTPIMVYHFNRFSPISFIVNPFILPAQPAVMILGGLSAFLSLFIFPLGQMLAWAAWPFAGYTIRMVELFNLTPIVFGDVPLWPIYIMYAALLALPLNASAIKNWFNSISISLRTVLIPLTVASLFICLVTFWNASARSGDGQFHIIFLEAGSADAVLIQTPQGRNVLINGGKNTADLSADLGRRLPYFTQSLDWLIIAATHEDQIAALPRLIERYPPEQVLWSGNSQASFSAGLLAAYFAQNEIPVTQAEPGQRLQLGEGAFIEVQAKSPRGSVLLIEYGNFSALLPIGVDEEVFNQLEYGNTLEKVDVLLLADSGYSPSNPPDLLENLNPQLVVLSVAPADPNGLPHPQVLTSLTGYSLLRTDQNGWINIATNGNEMQVTVERGEHTLESQK